MGAPNKLVDGVRQQPDQWRVRVQINQDPWEWMDGRLFLELWEQPFAGTIYVDRFERVFQWGP